MNDRISSIIFYLSFGKNVNAAELIEEKVGQICNKFKLFRSMHGRPVQRGIVGRTAGFRPVPVNRNTNTNSVGFVKVRHT